jgi:hypothetical protein
MSLLARLTPPPPEPQPEWVRRASLGMLPVKSSGIVADATQGTQRGTGARVTADATQAPVRRGLAA